MIPSYYIHHPEVGPVAGILLHGFCEDASIWEPVLSLLSDKCLITVDLPGFGASAPPAKADMAHLADAVLRILDAEKMEKTVVIGHSLGGYVALEWAARHPERMSGLGLLHSHPFEDNAERIEHRRRGIETLRSGKRDLYVAQLFPGLFAKAFAEQNPDIVQFLIKKGQKNTAEGIVSALETMIGRRNHEATLRNAPCPISWFLGEKDTLIPVEMAMKAAVLSSISRIHIEPDIGHMGMYESTETCARWIADTIDDQ
jgi:pimeloyl-ACP methyl ester carboxylesterase